jgi:uncharacterized protein YdeI (YjbR/CyaY-like superfamily)
MPPSELELPLLEFSDRSAWDAWLHEHHAVSRGIWMKFAKKSSPRQTVSHAEALEAALCFGWIDGQVGKVDGDYFRQRFTPRTARSKWSQINRESATALIERGSMQPAGLAEVDKAKQDGRWEAAYEPQAAATVPPDFQAALDAIPGAAEFFATLTGNRRYSFLYRIHDAKRPETRAKRIATFAAMCGDHQTLY